MYGAHDCLTGYRPRKWWMWFLEPFSKTQSKSIEEMYAAGVRAYDIRVRFGKNGELVACHGLSEYKVDVLKVAKWLEEHGCYYRVILENVVGRRKTKAGELDKLRSIFLRKKYAHCYWVCDKQHWDGGKNKYCDKKDMLGKNFHGKKYCIVPWLWRHAYDADRLKHAKNLPEDGDMTYWYDFV